MRRLQRVPPPGPRFGLQRFPGGQAQPLALRRGPDAGRLRRRRQSHFVAAGHHQRGKRPPQQLVERQDHDLLVRGRLGDEARSFQCVIGPGGEFREAETPCSLRQLQQLVLLRSVQPQCSDHLGSRGVAFQDGPLAGGLQQLADAVQPLRQRTRGAHGLAPSIDLLLQGLRAGSIAQVRRSDEAPLAQAGTAQAPLQRQHGAGPRDGRVLEPIDHSVAACVPRARAQGQHDTCGRARGGELPAGLVADSHTAHVQHRADAASQHPIDGCKRHRHAAGFHMPQHASRGPLGFVRRVTGLVQADLAGRPGNGKRQRNCLAGQPALELFAQRLGLQAFEHHEQVQAHGRDVFQQRIAGIRRCSGPLQRDARYRRLQCQRGRIEAGGHDGAGFGGPGLALLRSDCSGNAGQLPGRFDQAACEQFAPATRAPRAPASRGR